MPLRGSFRRTLVERVQTYAEGRTGDGSTLQGDVDERLLLVPQTENAAGDWVDDPAGVAVPFMFDGRGNAFEETDGGDTKLEELAIVTRTALADGGAYSYDGHSWTVSSGSSTAAASSGYAFAYVLHRHVT